MIWNLLKDTVYLTLTFPLIYHLGFTFTFWIWLAWQSLPPCWPYIRFLFVVVKESLHHFLHPSLTAFDLWFTTLGGKYLWSDFHRLAVRHARHTKNKASVRISTDALLKTTLSKESQPISELFEYRHGKKVTTAINLSNFEDLLCLQPYCYLDQISLTVPHY